MSKRGRARAAASPSVGPPVGDVDLSGVGAREPCPCGSGRRVKACHGRSARGGPARDPRPYAGLPGESDWVAMREIVPAATAGVRTVAEHQHRDVLVATVLPMAVAALVRSDGQVMVALQTMGASGDPSRDAGHALAQALLAEPGTMVSGGPTPGDAPRLQQLLDAEAPFEVHVHEGFDFWLDGTEDVDGNVTASLERANTSVVPTVRLTGVEAAYWCEVGTRVHLRWVQPHEEEALLDALARLHERGADGLGEGSRLLGTFRAHGLLVPVWDLAPGTRAAEVEEPAARFATRLAEALDEATPLSASERGARAGLANRQLTLR